MDFGVNTFGDMTVAEDGTRLSYAQVIRNIIAQAELTEQLGLDAFTVGEHHRDDFAVSAPEVVLAAIAGRTSRIKLGTAVTVLSSDDPVRVYERFATLDAVSHGRAQIMLGRGSFTESFPLFGYDLTDYDRLFDEKLDLMLALLMEKAVTWSGSVRSSLSNQEVYPKTESGHIPVSIAVGSKPDSLVRTAQHGLPVVLAIVGSGNLEHFASYADLYRRALAQAGAPEQPVAAQSDGFVADTDQEAIETLWPHVRDFMTRVARERGSAPPTRERFEEEVRSGTYPAGSPETVAQKIARTISAIGLERFDLRVSAGTLPHEKIMRSIELYATRVVPRVKELLA